MTKTDTQLKQEIEAELLWDPKIDAAQMPPGTSCAMRPSMRFAIWRE